MSNQAFEDFAKKVDTSTEIKKEADEAYRQLGDTLSQAHMTYFDAMVDLGKQSGFEFSTADVMKKFETSHEELDDAQLESVAGGAINVRTISPTTTSFNPSLPGYTAPITRLDPGTVAGT